jgi:hypothetical protein
LFNLGGAGFEICGVTGDLFMLLRTYLWFGHVDFEKLEIGEGGFFNAPSLSSIYTEQFFFSLIGII